MTTVPTWAGVKVTDGTHLGEGDGDGGTHLGEGDGDGGTYLGGGEGDGGTHLGEGDGDGGTHLGGGEGDGAAAPCTRYAVAGVRRPAAAVLRSTPHQHGRTLVHKLHTQLLWRRRRTWGHSGSGQGGEGTYIHLNGDVIFFY